MALSARNAVRHLEQWAKGAFQDDWPGPPAEADFDLLPFADQPGALDFASLSRYVGARSSLALKSLT